MPNDTSTPLLTVSDAASRLGVTPRTLKYYEERGAVTRSEAATASTTRPTSSASPASCGCARSVSLHGITEMLKRPLEETGDGRRRYSDASLRDIRTGLAEQVDTLDRRIAAVQRELKEAIALRKELQHDIDYVERRLAGENADALIAQRQAEAGTRRTRKARE